MGEKHVETAKLQPCCIQEAGGQAGEEAECGRDRGETYGSTTFVCELHQDVYGL